jgi:hypothetical protein
MLSRRTIPSSQKPSVKVAAPRVKEVPIHFECKLNRVLELGPNRHPLVIGEVVYMHVDPACMTNGRLNVCNTRRHFGASVFRRSAALALSAILLSLVSIHGARVEADVAPAFTVGRTEEVNPTEGLSAYGVSSAFCLG